MPLLLERTDKLTRIAERIQDKLPFRVRQFQLEAGEDGLVLLGTARSYYEKQLIQEAALRASEMPIAANEIAVSLSGPRR